MAAKGEKVKRTIDDFTVSEANIKKDPGPEEDKTIHQMFHFVNSSILFFNFTKLSK